MENLPNEWLEQILSFLPIADVFISMMVSRKWEAAARYVVRNRDMLVVSSPCYEWGTPPVAPMDTIAAKKDIDDVMRSLLQMNSLKRLDFYCDRQSCNIVSLVLQNASSLRSLYFPADLPTKAGAVVRFPFLKQLFCHHIGKEQVAACSRLVGLKVTFQKSPDIIAVLNSSNIQNFSYRSDVLPTFEPEFKTVIQAIVRLENLTVLHLVMWLKECRDLDPFVRLFQRLRKLQEVDFSLSDKDLFLDPVVRTLVRYNPSIRHISLIGMKMTDDSLIALSQLSHLSYLKFCPEWERSVTTAGMLSFLRGGSRHVLPFCCLCSNVDLDIQLINDEIISMEREIGRTFDRTQDEPNCIHYSC